MESFSLKSILPFLFFPLGKVSHMIGFPGACSVRAELDSVILPVQSTSYRNLLLQLLTQMQGALLAAGTRFINICILPGGGTQVQRGCAPALRISRKKGYFLRPPHVRDFVKEGYSFVLRYEVWGSKSPYNPRNIRGSDAE